MMNKKYNKNIGCGFFILGLFIFIIIILRLICDYFSNNHTALAIFLSIVIIIFFTTAIISFIKTKKRKVITASLYDIDNMNGLDFEHFTASLLRNMGYCNVTVTPASNDYGIDVLAEKNGTKYAIQCKRYAHKVDNSAVQEVVAGRTYYNCNQGIVITNNYFTDNARNLAQMNNVILWDRTDLTKMLSVANKANQNAPSSETKNVKDVFENAEDTEEHIINDIKDGLGDNETAKIIREINETTQRNREMHGKTLDEIELPKHSLETFKIPSEHSPAVYHLPSIDIFNSESLSDNNSVKIYGLLDTFEFMNSKHSFCLGINEDKTPVYCDLIKSPHILISGETGTGKSICMNSIIVSLLLKAKPDEIKFLMIDPKSVEFSKYEDIPHLLVPVVTDPKKASGALYWAVSEMLKRYQRFLDIQVRDIKSYNAFVENHDDMETMPEFCIFVDGLELLMLDCKKEMEDSICRIVQMGRAAGMHIIIASQQERIAKKFNISTTIKTKIDNEITDNPYKLIYKTSNTKPITINSCIAFDTEIEKMCDYIKNQGENQYSDEFQKGIEDKIAQNKTSYKFADGSDGNKALDPLFEKAVEVVLESGRASTSLLQRKLSIGYSRGSNIMEQLEDKDIIGPQYGAEQREILINMQQWIQMKANNFDLDFTEEKEPNELELGF